MNYRQRDQEAAALLANIVKELPRLEALWRKYSSHWDYEDPIYRFYHQSFKVFHLQSATEEIVAALQSLAPHLALNEWFMEIVRQGTGKTFTEEMNSRWTQETRPIVEAFFHVRYFLEHGLQVRPGTERAAPDDAERLGGRAVPLQPAVKELLQFSRIAPPRRTGLPASIAVPECREATQP